MSAAICGAPLETAVLTGYWLGELDGEREGEVEAHLFACAACAGSLEHLVALGDSLRELVRSGDVLAVVSDAFLKRLAAAGIRLNQYRVPRNGSVNCTIAPDDQVAIARLEAPLGGVERVDIVLKVGEGFAHERLEDVPFDPEAGEIAVTPRIARLRELPASTSIVQLVSVTPEGEQILGEYRFNHTPWAGARGT